MFPAGKGIEREDLRCVELSRFDLLPPVPGAGLLIPFAPEAFQRLALEERADTVGSRPFFETLDEVLLWAQSSPVTGMAWYLLGKTFSFQP
jgi:hypothetical protein